jgi:hypothetical protein
MPLLLQWITLGIRLSNELKLLDLKLNIRTVSELMGMRIAAPMGVMRPMTARHPATTL